MQSTQVGAVLELPSALLLSPSAKAGHPSELPLGMYLIDTLLFLKGANRRGVILESPLSLFNPFDMVWFLAPRNIAPPYQCQ